MRRCTSWGGVSVAKLAVSQPAGSAHPRVLQYPVCSVGLRNVCRRPPPACFLLCMLLFKSGPAVFMNVFSGSPSVLNEMA